jgi:AcrR family transcriptional regulator
MCSEIGKPKVTQQEGMTRTYTLKKRAEKQADTRRRIAEATLELHSTVGPANTTLSMVAERACVQRHTLYAHFPDEMSLFMACSGLLEDRDPPPAAEPWRGIEDRDERLRTGLTTIYAWYERNASLLACVLRDAEVHAPTRQIAELRFAPYVAAYHEVLGARLSAKQRPMLHLALSFFTWREGYGAGHRLRRQGMRSGPAPMPPAPDRTRPGRQ